MPRFIDPSFTPSLKDARYWSLDWIKEQNIRGPFEYVVLLKAEGGYKVFGQWPTATEAFDDRRQLAIEHGTRSFFIRAVRVRPVEVVGPGHPDSREDLDRFRDALSTGDESLIQPEELPAFRSWAARTIEDRAAYQRVSRDTPQLVDNDAEVPF